MAKKVDLDIVPKFAQGAVGKMSGALSGVLGHVAQNAGGGAVGIAGGVQQIEAVLKPIMNLVAKVNPGLVEKLELAFENIFAVIGQSLEPVLEAILPLIQKFGDFIATILPSQAAMNDYVEALKPLFDTLTDVMQKLGPYIHVVIEALMQLTSLFEWIRNFIFHELLGAALGVIPDLGGNKSSQGAAFRQASYSGIQELGSSFAQAAFSEGTDTQSPQQKQVGFLEEIRNYVNAIKQFVEDIAHAPAKLAENLGDRAGQAWDATGIPGLIDSITS
jgi:hypothetical protein